MDAGLSGRWVSVFVIALVLTSGCSRFGRGDAWWQARRDSSGQAPDPATTPAPVLQIYAARAVGWRGVLAVHTWIAVKPTGASNYTRYEVIGWGVDRGVPAVRINRMGPDNYWFGAKPVRLVDRRGDGVDALIAQVRRAVESYPYPATYRIWPGPNSNTFTAYVGRSVPELNLRLPPTAIGKDYLPGGAVVARTPGGDGAQISVLGVAGLLAGVTDGVEVNVLGLTFGLDLRYPALKLPGIGRVGSP